MSKKSNRNIFNKVQLLSNKTHLSTITTVVMAVFQVNINQRIPPEFFASPVLEKTFGDLQVFMVGRLSCYFTTKVNAVC